MLAPICLFTYNRYNETVQTIEALKNNYLASESDLIIFSDGAKKEQDKIKIEAVQQYIRSVTGFHSVEIIQSEKNKGLASSIIAGASQILQKYGRVIVMEDDLVSSPNFLNFMNEALDYYKNDLNIQSVNGSSLALSDKNRDVNFQIRTFSWGWGTWSNRWSTDIFNKEELRKVIQSQPSILKEFKKLCGADMPKMLMNSINNKNDSWYVRWAFDHFRKKHYAVFPTYSYIKNIGHNADATHCKGINSYIIEPVNPGKKDFNFQPFSPPDPKSTREFLHYFSMQHKISVRISLLKTTTGRMQLINEFKMKMGFK